MNEEEDTTLEDWHAMCRGEADFDSSHFFTLFLDPLTIEEVKDALAYFPGSEEMASKVLDRLDLVDLGVDPESQTPEWLVEQTKKYVSKVIELFEQKGEPELASKLREVEVEYHPDGNYVQDLGRSSEFNREVFGRLSDIVNFSFVDDDRVNGLLEAFYGITTDTQMKWYLASPFLTVDPGCEYYYNVARIGGAIAFVPRKCYVGLRTLAYDRQ